MSITKSFTGTLGAMLVAEGTLAAASLQLPPDALQTLNRIGATSR